LHSLQRLLNMYIKINVVDLRLSNARYCYAYHKRHGGKIAGHAQRCFQEI
jgi:hypothetical protein